MVVVVASGLAFAYWLPDVVAGLKIWFKVAPILGMAFWLGLLWRRATVAGAWASAIVALAAWWLATRGFVVEAVQGWAIAAPWRLVWHRSGAPAEIYEPWQIAFYLAAGTLAGIVVSLLTRPVARRAARSVLCPDPHADRAGRGRRRAVHAPGWGRTARTADARDGLRPGDPPAVAHLGARVPRRLGGGRRADRMRSFCWSGSEGRPDHQATLPQPAGAFAAEHER